MTTQLGGGGRVPTGELTSEQDAQLARVGQWLIETCLLFGAQRKTAYLVAGAFVEGLEREWRKRGDSERDRGVKAPPSLLPSWPAR